MKIRRTLSQRFATTVLLAGMFLASLTGTAAAADGIGSLDILGLLGLKPPPVAQASAPAPPPPGDVPPPPAAAAAPAATLDASSIPANSGAGRRVVYSVSQQRVWLVNEDGSLHGTWLVSGRAGEPNPGSYSVFSRSRHARAQRPGITMEYMVRFVRTAGLPIGFHSIPVNRRGAKIQSIEQLGTYQSLGCVRQRYEDAVVMWEFAQIGTPVIVPN
ncbi:MAG TPA: L,D-transpeptidase [Actinomycetota bacterium]|jgi:lipoprotein-anchoring transpeptidase ErfK/SrfK|nr:L,D-transpeptidase [Actinomycetota bacterium]